MTTLITALAVYLIGCVLSYGYMMYIWNHGDIPPKLCIPQESFKEFRINWEFNFDKEWNKCIGWRRGYIRHAWTSCIFSWISFISTLSIWETSFGLMWRIQPLPDKEQFRWRVNHSGVNEKLLESHTFDYTLN